jgi:hypothetical protein
MARRRKRNFGFGGGKKTNWLLIGAIGIGAYLLLKNRGRLFGLSGLGAGCCNHNPMGTLYSEDAVTGPYGEASSGGDGLGVPGNVLFQPVFPHASDESSSW